MDFCSVGIFLSKIINKSEKTLQVLTRNMTHDIVRNIATWWMDLGGTGWFNDAELWKLKVALKDSETDIIKNGMQYENDIALIFDETSALYCGFGPLPTAMYNEMARIAGIHQYTDVPAAVYTNGTYFSITPTDIPEGQTRKITFTIKEDKDIVDVMTGEKLGTKTFSKIAKRGDTFFVKIIK